MKVLFHVCCGPCAIVPFRALLEGGNEATGFFYNPNIHPYTEMARRRGAVEELFRKSGWPLIIQKYDMDRFFAGLDGVYEPGRRCRICWRMRLAETARFAKENGFGAFTTSLLISPYQDQEAIKAIGGEEASRAGVEFLFADYRGLFRMSQDEAKAEGLYRQKYCGCVFAERERFDKSLKKPDNGPAAVIK